MTKHNGMVESHSKPISTWANQAAQIKQEYIDACKRIEELREENDKLKAALSPFADESKEWKAAISDSCRPYIGFGDCDPTGAEFTVGDLRRAAKLLEN